MLPRPQHTAPGVLVVVTDIPRLALKEPIWEIALVAVLPSSFGQVQFLLFLPSSLLPLVPPLLPFPSPHILSSSTRRRRRIYPTSWQKRMEGVVGGWSALILLCRKRGHLVTLLPPPPPTTSSGATSLPPPAALCVIYEVGLVGGRVCVCVCSSSAVAAGNESSEVGPRKKERKKTDFFSSFLLISMLSSYRLLLLPTLPLPPLSHFLVCGRGLSLLFPFLLSRVACVGVS